MENPHLHIWASPGELTVVQFTDDSGWSHEQVWTSPKVNRSGDVFGFAVCTPGSDEYVEALAAHSYAQITRLQRAFAYRAEGDGDVVQFPKVISDDEMARLICVGGGRFRPRCGALEPASASTAATTVQERIAVPQTVACGMNLRGRGESDESGGKGAHSPAEETRVHAQTLGCVGSWVSSPPWHEVSPGADFCCAWPQESCQSRSASGVSGNS